MNKYVERLYNGIVKENPTMVQFLGMCPTLAVTTSVINGVGMGLSTTVVLVLSNIMISALRKIIPDKVRVPAFIVVVASFVTMVQLLMQGFLPSLYESLGIYIPLIVVNCIILGRAEAYASKNTIGLSMFDGFGMGIGFTISLSIIGAIRELLGNGSLLGYNLFGEAFTPITIFILAPGAFFVLAVIVAVRNYYFIRKADKGKISAAEVELVEIGCEGCLMQESCKGKAAEKSEPVKPVVKPAPKTEATQTKPEAESKPEAEAKPAEEDGKGVE
ncbi:MAG: electron transport complex subunit E [Eubacterium sp.]|nr:electron transport complex subunit E [Eubacterium sp.]